MGADTDRLAPAGVIPVTEWFRTIIRNFPPTAAAHPDAGVCSMPVHTEKLRIRIHRNRGDGRRCRITSGGPTRTRTSNQGIRVFRRFPFGADYLFTLHTLHGFVRLGCGTL